MYFIYEKAMKTTILRIAGAAVLLLGMPVSAAAEENQAYTLAPVVVTATRTENPVSRIPAAVQVITEEDIKAVGADSLRQERIPIFCRDIRNAAAGMMSSSAG